MGSLVIRRRRDGSTTFESDLPPSHEFSARFIEREIETGLVEVTVKVTTDDGEVEYKLDGFAVIEDPETGEERPNFTGWRCTKTTAKKKRR